METNVNLIIIIAAMLFVQLPWQPVKILAAIGAVVSTAHMAIVVLFT